jgi:LysM repeat protein
MSKNNISIYLTRVIVFVLFIFIFIVCITANISAQRYLEYQTKEGDSIWSITRQFQLSIHEVAQVNKIEQDERLSPGQLIKIPTNEEDNSSSNGVVSTLTYTVQKGESLWDIAQQYRLSLEDISAVNDLNETNSLPIGQEIKIPIDSTKKEEAKKEEQSGLSFKKDKLNFQGMTTSLKQEFRDLVKEANSTGRENESLWTITQNYQVSLKDLSQTNDLVNSKKLSMDQIIQSSLDTRSVNKENGKKESNGKEPLQNILQPSIDQKLDFPVTEQPAEQEKSTSVAQIEKPKKKWYPLCPERRNSVANFPKISGERTVYCQC